MIHLRRYLDYLVEVVDEKSYVADKTREELKKCREQIQSLEKERDGTFLEIQKVDSEGNTCVLSINLRSSTFIWPKKRTTCTVGELFLISNNQVLHLIRL